MKKRQQILIDEISETWLGALQRDPPPKNVCFLVLLYFAILDFRCTSDFNPFSPYNRIDPTFLYLSIESLPPRIAIIESRYDSLLSRVATVGSRNVFCPPHRESPPSRVVTISVSPTENRFLFSPPRIDFYSSHQESISIFPTENRYHRESRPFHQESRRYHFIESHDHSTKSRVTTISSRVTTIPPRVESLPFHQEPPPYSSTKNRHHITNESFHFLESHFHFLESHFLERYLSDRYLSPKLARTVGQTASWHISSHTTHTTYQYSERRDKTKTNTAPASIIN